MRATAFGQLFKHRGLPPPTEGATARVVGDGARASGHRLRASPVPHAGRLGGDEARPMMSMLAATGGLRAQVRRRRSQCS